MKAGDVRLRRLFYFALIGIVSISAAVLHAQSGRDTSGEASKGWWNRRLPRAEPIHIEPPIYQKIYSLVGRPADSVALDYLEDNWKRYIDEEAACPRPYVVIGVQPGMREMAVGFQQYYRGIKVDGGEFAIVLSTYGPSCYPQFHGRAFLIKGLDVTPTLSRENAVAALKSEIAPDSLYSTELVDTVIYDDREPIRERMRKLTADLIVYPSEQPALVYRVSASVWVFNQGNRGFVFLVDAKTGELLQSSSLSEDWDPALAFGYKRPSPPAVMTDNCDQSWRIEGTDFAVRWGEGGILERCDLEDRRHYQGGKITALPEAGEQIEVDEQPVLLREFRSTYPSEAIAACAEGNVWVRVLILSDGVVGIASVVKSSGTDFGFDRAALEAAIQSVYRPAMREGIPVAHWHTYNTRFRLRDLPDSVSVKY